LINRQAIRTAETRIPLFISNLLDRSKFRAIDLFPLFLASAFLFLSGNVSPPSSHLKS
jgi:hypothetical protein